MQGTNKSATPWAVDGLMRLSGVGRVRPAAAAPPPQPSAAAGAGAGTAQASSRATRLPQHVREPAVRNAPAPGLRTKLAPMGVLLFVMYSAALVAYVAVRVTDIVRRMADKPGERAYSCVILAVELIGVSALLPYAFVNIRHVLPTKESEDDGEARTWEAFGCHSSFDIFVIVPCYKESWPTIKRTLMCAMLARMPPGCRKHIILGNDGHDQPDDNCRHRRDLLQQLVDGVDRMYPGGRLFQSVYVSERPKVRKGEDGRDLLDPATGKASRIAGNSKSLNVNTCIKLGIPELLRRFHPQCSGDPAHPRLCDFDAAVLRKSVVVVLDCDMAIYNDANEYGVTGPPRNGDGMGFFPKILRVLEDDRLDLVLTPQFFTNINMFADAFNHLNPQFWEYILPGLTALGYVACTGTNMGLRLSMLHEHSPRHDRGESAAKEFAPGQSIASARYEAAVAGPFPTYSVTEDYGLSLELKKRGIKGTYIAEYLVRGAAPDGIKAVDIQRGRWTEGHYQIFFSFKNPFFSPFKLGFWGWVYYNYGTLAYLATILTFVVYQFVPLLSAFGIQPVEFTEQFRWTCTAYLLTCTGVQYYARAAPHFFGMWRANMSNILLSWTYAKAIGRALARVKSPFATHTAAEDAPEQDRILAQPPMPDPQPESLVKSVVKPGWCLPEKDAEQSIFGHVVWFSIWLMVAAATIITCVARTIKARHAHSHLLLPAAWAAYNSAGSVLFLCAVRLKRTKSLELAMFIICSLQFAAGALALIALLFVNNSLTIVGRPDAPDAPGAAAAGL